MEQPADASLFPQLQLDFAGRRENLSDVEGRKAIPGGMTGDGEFVSGLQKSSIPTSARQHSRI
jgi:hypothetical protein